MGIHVRSRLNTGAFWRTNASWKVMVLVGSLMTWACSAPSPAASAPAAFWPHWGDGLAEVNGYRLTQPRYGEKRHGTAVHIFVTETFSDSARVKSDPGKHPPTDEFPVLKLNEIKKFQTGIYPYSVMTSAFAHVEPRASFAAGDLTKLTFSSQEWCGHVFEEMRFDAKEIRDQRLSYFDGEGTELKTLPRKAGGVSADALPIRLRQVLGEWVAPGQSKTVDFLPSLTYTRLQHKTLEWSKATVSRAVSPQTLTVPAGTFEVEQWEVKAEVGPSTTWWLEKAYPHRIIGWEGSDGERAELTGSKRIPYWQLNKPGDEAHLQDLGLSVSP